MIEINNTFDRPITLCLEPSGHALKMQPGALFQVYPYCGETLRVVTDENYLVVEGHLARVTNGDVVLAKWTDDVDAVRTADELRVWLGRRDQIVATVEGAFVMREVDGKRFAAGVMLSDEQELVVITGGPVTATTTQLEAAVVRANEAVLVPGFRVVADGVRYTIVVFREADGAISTYALRRALREWFSAVAEFEKGTW